MQDDRFFVSKNKIKLKHERKRAWKDLLICCRNLLLHWVKISWPQAAWVFRPGRKGCFTRADVVTPCHLQLWYQLESTPEHLLSTTHTVYTYGIKVLIRTSSFQIVLIDTDRNQTLPCSDLTLNSIRIILLVGDSATPGPSSSSVAVENRMGFCWEVSPGKKKSTFFTTEKRFFTTIQLRIFPFPAETVSKDFKPQKTSSRLSMWEQLFGPPNNLSLGCLCWQSIIVSVFIQVLSTILLK